MCIHKYIFICNSVMHVCVCVAATTELLKTVYIHIYYTLCRTSLSRSALSVWLHSGFATLQRHSNLAAPRSPSNCLTTPQRRDIMCHRQRPTTFGQPKSPWNAVNAAERISTIWCMLWRVCQQVNKNNQEVTTKNLHQNSFRLAAWSSLKCTVSN